MAARTADGSPRPRDERPTRKRPARDHRDRQRLERAGDFLEDKGKGQFIADRLHTAGKYLQENDARTMARSIDSAICAHPYRGHADRPRHRLGRRQVPQPVATRTMAITLHPMTRTRARAGSSRHPRRARTHRSASWSAGWRTRARSWPSWSSSASSVEMRDQAPPRGTTAAAGYLAVTCWLRWRRWPCRSGCSWYLADMWHGLRGGRRSPPRRGSCSLAAGAGPRPGRCARVSLTAGRGADASADAPERNGIRGT